MKSFLLPGQTVDGRSCETNCVAVVCNGTQGVAEPESFRGHNYRVDTKGYRIELNFRISKCRGACALAGRLSGGVSIFPAIVVKLFSTTPGPARFGPDREKNDRGSLSSESVNALLYRIKIEPFAIRGGAPSPAALLSSRRPFERKKLQNTIKQYN